MLNESPYESPDETESECAGVVVIQGAFIAANPVKRGKYLDFQWIKLSSINSIDPIYEDGEKRLSNYCYFKTYKDCIYFTHCSVFDLRKAIDTFLFRPDEHWENYSY